MLHRLLMLLAVIPLLSACLAQSQAQYGYDVAKSECQTLAAAQVAANPMMSETSDTSLKTAFSNCMKKQGWKLATTKKPTTITQPISTPSGAGVSPVTAAATASPAAAAAPASVAREPVPTAAATSAAPPTAAAPSVATQPAPAGLAPIPSGASTYQPTPPAASPVAPTVSPGRNFGP